MNAADDGLPIKKVEKGYQVTRKTLGSPLSGLSLEKGDIIVKANGYLVVDMKNHRKIYFKALGKDRLTVEVERQGRLISIEYLLTNYDPKNPRSRNQK